MSILTSQSGGAGTRADTSCVTHFLFQTLPGAARADEAGTELKSNSEPKLATRLMSLNESGERRRSVTLEAVVRAE